MLVKAGNAISQIRTLLVNSQAILCFSGENHSIKAIKRKIVPWHICFDASGPRQLKLQATRTQIASTKDKERGRIKWCIGFGEEHQKRFNIYRDAVMSTRKFSSQNVLPSFESWKTWRAFSQIRKHENINDRCSTSSMLRRSAKCQHFLPKQFWFK